MDDSIIYEERFSKLMDEFDGIADTNVDFPKAPSHADPMAYTQELFGKTVSILMPERIGKTEIFIQMAKEIGHSYCMDTVIRREYDQVVATFTLIDGGDFSCLKSLINMADEIHCTTSKTSILLRVIFYTHSTYLNGRKVIPPDK